MSCSRCGREYCPWYRYGSWAGFKPCETSQEDTRESKVGSAGAVKRKQQRLDKVKRRAAKAIGKLAAGRMEPNGLRAIPGSTYTEDEDGMTRVWAPDGTFRMQLPTELAREMRGEKPA